MPSLGSGKDRLTEVSMFHVPGLMSPQAPVRGALPIRLIGLTPAGDMFAGALKAFVSKYLTAPAQLGPWPRLQTVRLPSGPLPQPPLMRALPMKLGLVSGMHCPNSGVVHPP